MSLALWVPIVCLLGVKEISAYDWDILTPLDEYVHAPDDNFNFVQLEHYEYDLVDSYVLNMTSQQWLDETLVDRTIWFHYMVINVPKNLRFTESALLFIGEGGNNENPPNPERDSFNRLLITFSEVTGAISGYIRQVPNQSIRFFDDPAGGTRSEDSLIAYTWRKFIDNPNGDPTGIAQFPMTKAAVRAMDTMQIWGEENLGIQLKEFMTAGGSKRGWISWLTACVDHRVFAIAPMVLSALNFTENLHHHYMAMGGWSFAFTSYYNQDIPQEINNPNAELLFDLIDPYEFRERLTLPIVYVGATGDEFFTPSDTYFFFDDLPSEQKYLFWVVNAEHTLIPQHFRVRNTMISFFLALKDPDFKLPQIRWDMGEDETSGYIDVYTDVEPASVTGWWADTVFRDIRRDFRVVQANFPFARPIFWIPNGVEQLADGGYRFRRNKTPDHHFRGFLIELTFDGVEGRSLTFTTEINIIPNTFPFPRCQNEEECRGSLL